MTTEITVRGSYSAFEPPERATAQIRLAFEGPQMQPVYDRVVRDLQAVTATITPLHHPEQGPVTWWSTQQVSTWSEKPWNQEGKQLPLIHHARAGLQVKFRDFSALARWIGPRAESEGFSLEGVEWALTEKRKAELARQVRTRAVQDAAARAQEYADALGLGPVRPVALADAGMLSSGLHPMGVAEAASFMRAGKMADSDASLTLAPDDIEVAAVVDGRFVAG